MVRCLSMVPPNTNRDLVTEINDLHARVHLLEERVNFGT